jgi:hypothetical protein
VILIVLDVKARRAVGAFGRTSVEWMYSGRLRRRPRTRRIARAQRTEGDDEHGGVARRYPSGSSFVAAAKPHCPGGRDERFVSALGRFRCRQRRAAHRRTRRNARAHRDGRWRWGAGVNSFDLQPRAPQHPPTFHTANARGERRDRRRARSPMTCRPTSDGNERACARRALSVRAPAS